MRKLFMTALCVVGFAAAASAETIHVGVNGLVCAFCVKGIEKSFKAEAEVKRVNVDLDNKKVTIETNENQTMDDAKITRLITDAGFNVTSIHHEN